LTFFSFFPQGASGAQNLIEEEKMIRKGMNFVRLMVEFAFSQGTLKIYGTHVSLIYHTQKKEESLS
jgi:hypothetical protein